MIQRLGAVIHPDLMALKTQAMMQTQAEAVVITLLPEALKPHARVTRFARGCLTISVSEAVWLTLLRYQLPTLRDQLRQHALFYGLCSIEVDVQPGLHEIERKKPVFVDRPLSPSVRELIKNTGEQVTYEPLSRALIRLASMK